MPDFTALNKLHNLAIKASVSWALNYSESDDSWYIVISSIAPSENFIGRNRSFLTAIDDAQVWLNYISIPK